MANNETIPAGLDLNGRNPDPESADWNVEIPYGPEPEVMGGSI
jgi:hypothetical protein